MLAPPVVASLNRPNANEFLNRTRVERDSYYRQAHAHSKIGNGGYHLRAKDSDRAASSDSKGSEGKLLNSCMDQKDELIKVGIDNGEFMPSKLRQSMGFK